MVSDVITGNQTTRTGELKMMTSGKQVAVDLLKSVEVLLDNEYELSHGTDEESRRASNLVRSLVYALTDGSRTVTGAAQEFDFIIDYEKRIKELAKHQA